MIFEFYVAPGVPSGTRATKMERSKGRASRSGAEPVPIGALPGRDATEDAPAARARAGVTG
jgi:hypothetical protein